MIREGKRSKTAEIRGAGLDGFCRGLRLLHSTLLWLLHLNLPLNDDSDSYTHKGKQDRKNVKGVFFIHPIQLTGVREEIYSCMTICDLIVAICEAGGLGHQAALQHRGYDL